MKYNVDIRDIDELVWLSANSGKDTSLTEGGGGNSSVKSTDGKLLYVKASGTALKDMTRRRGWLATDRQALVAILDCPHLVALPAEPREKQVVRAILSSRVDMSRYRPGLVPLKSKNLPIRPSVECSLHAVMADRVVLHTHPRDLNALLCSRRAKDLIPHLKKFCDQEPAWLGYTDPGYTLAKATKRMLARYRRTHGHEPNFIFMANHGLIVGADTARQALLGTRRVMAGLTAVARIARRKGFAPDKTPRLPRSPLKEQIAGLSKLMRGLRQSLVAQGLPHTLRWCESPRLRALSKRPDIRRLLSGPTTPEDILFSGRGPAIVTNPENTDPQQLFARHDRRFGGLLRIVDVLPAGFIAVGESPRKCRLICEAYESHLEILLGSLAFGGPRLLANKNAAYLDGWGPSKYRGSIL